MKKLSLLFSALACAGALAWADPIDSEYCGQVMSSGNTEAAFEDLHTWDLARADNTQKATSQWKEAAHAFLRLLVFQWDALFRR